jgi:hypothetical protein
VRRLAAILAADGRLQPAHRHRRGRDARAAAQPGGVLVSEDAWHQVRGKVVARFVDLGQKHLTNIARPVHVLAVEVDDGAAPRPHAAPGFTCGGDRRDSPPQRRDGQVSPQPEHQREFVACAYPYRGVGTLRLTARLGYQALDSFHQRTGKRLRGGGQYSSMLGPIQQGRFTLSEVMV